MSGRQLEPLANRGRFDWRLGHRAESSVAGRLMLASRATSASIWNTSLSAKG
jgi:hypothetical protein